MHCLASAPSNELMNTHSIAVPLTALPTLRVQLGLVHVVSSLMNISLKLWSVRLDHPFVHHYSARPPSPPWQALDLRFSGSSPTDHPQLRCARVQRRVQCLVAAAQVVRRPQPTPQHGEPQEPSRRFDSLSDHMQQCHAPTSGQFHKLQVGGNAPFTPQRSSTTNCVARERFCSIWTCLLRSIQIGAVQKFRYRFWQTVDWAEALAGRDSLHRALHDDGDEKDALQHANDRKDDHENDE